MPRVCRRRLDDDVDDASGVQGRGRNVADRFPAENDTKGEEEKNSVTNWHRNRKEGPTRSIPFDFRHDFRLRIGQDFVQRRQLVLVVVVVRRPGRHLVVRFRQHADHCGRRFRHLLRSAGVAIRHGPRIHRRRRSSVDLATLSAGTGNAARPIQRIKNKTLATQSDTVATISRFLSGRSLPLHFLGRLLAAVGHEVVDVRPALDLLRRRRLRPFPHRQTCWKNGTSQRQRRQRHASDNHVQVDNNKTRSNRRKKKPGRTAGTTALLRDDRLDDRSATASLVDEFTLDVASDTSAAKINSRRH